MGDLTHRLPSTVTIGPHVYTVDSSADTGRLLRDENSCGDSRPDHLLIRLDPDRPPTSIAETLLHEIVHCCWSLTALRAIEHPDEEQAATALAPWLLAMLRDNPAVVDYLTAD